MNLKDARAVRRTKVEQGQVSVQFNDEPEDTWHPVGMVDLAPTIAPMPRQPSTAKCENCRFWERRPTGKSQEVWGYCHRNPPIPAYVMDERPLEERRLSGFTWVTSWPHLLPGAWCGEFQPAQEEQTQTETDNAKQNTETGQDNGGGGSR